MAQERCIKTEGAPNLRDLGGYPVAGGGTVKWGKVYRSDDLYDLTDADMPVLNRLGIRLIVDFRTRHEAMLSPDRLPESVRESVNIPIDAGKVMAQFHDENLNARKTRGIMLSVYRDLAHDFQPAFREFFRLLADDDNIPLLFHCTAGKDRTGFAAAMFLTALGVDRPTVMEDYLLSVQCLEKRYREGVDYDEIMRPLYRVEPEFIGAAFDVVDRQFGGPERYLRECLGVDLELFRKRFIE
jgi:Protein tyrosine/serine phosphatase